jgi:hypothetical protein
VDHDSYILLFFNGRTQCCFLETHDAHSSYHRTYDCGRYRFSEIILQRIYEGKSGVSDAAAGQDSFV